MRSLFIILAVALAVLQHKLWLGDGNIIQWIKLEKKLEIHRQDNAKLAARNRVIEADIQELKSGDQALEEQARFELGMIRDSETYYQFVD
jgi:cell division protein FtsB